MPPPTPQSTEKRHGKAMVRAPPDNTPARDRKSKGSVRASLEPARGPVPKSGEPKYQLKSKGVHIPEDHMAGPLRLGDFDGAAAYWRYTSGPTPKGSKRSITPPSARHAWKLSEMETSDSDADPAHYGIRVLGYRKKKDKEIRRERKEREMAIQRSAYVFSTPYANSTEPYMSPPHLMSRRPVTPSPSRVRSMSAASHQFLGSLSDRGDDTPRTRRNLSCKPVEPAGGIFAKLDQTSPSRKARHPIWSPNKRIGDIVASPEREFLPTTYRERGMSIRREGSQALNKGSGRVRPSESLLKAWNVADDAPIIKRSFTRKHDSVSNIAAVPWGTARKNSITQFRRKTSFDKVELKKPLRGRSHQSPNFSTASLCSLGYDSGPDTPRSGKRVFRTPSQSSPWAHANTAQHS
ncbi:hypothetical protein DIPPA_17092 [Diplonema papillatum]|nr:hypothetical protein DIPPA_17092 [Diplonema papillatum]